MGFKAFIKAFLGLFLGHFNGLFVKFWGTKIRSLDITVKFYFSTVIHRESM